MRVVWILRSPTHRGNVEGADGVGERGGGERLHKATLLKVGWGGGKG